MKIVNDTYKQVNGINMPVRIYYPENEKNDVLVIAIHGGGWHAVTKNEEWNGNWMAYQAEYYAKRGYTGAVFSYRSIDITEDTDVFDLYEDCRDAVKYITERVDYKKIVFMGDSAGGHLAMLLGLDDDIKTDIVVACNPVLDLTDEKWAYTAADEETRRNASPYYNPKAVDTKFLFMHGKADSVVLCEVTEKYHDMMKELGVSTELVTFEGVSHAFILKNYKSTDEEIERYMDIIDDYLKRML